MVRRYLGNVAKHRPLWVRAGLERVAVEAGRAEEVHRADIAQKRRKPLGHERLGLAGHEPREPEHLQPQQLLEFWAQARRPRARGDHDRVGEPRALRGAHHDALLALLDVDHRGVEEELRAVLLGDVERAHHGDLGPQTAAVLVEERDIAVVHEVLRVLDS